MLKIPKRWRHINAYIVISGILDIIRITYKIRLLVLKLLANYALYYVKEMIIVYKFELIL